MLAADAVDQFRVHLHIAYKLLDAVHNRQVIQNLIWFEILKAQEAFLDEFGFGAENAQHRLFEDVNLILGDLRRLRCLVEQFVDPGQAYLQIVIIINHINKKFLVGSM